MIKTVCLCLSFVCLSGCGVETAATAGAIAAVTVESAKNAEKNKAEALSGIEKAGVSAKNRMDEAERVNDDSLPPSTK